MATKSKQFYRPMGAFTMGNGPVYAHEQVHGFFSFAVAIGRAFSSPILGSRNFGFFMHAKVTGAGVGAVPASGDLLRGTSGVARRGDAAACLIERSKSVRKVSSSSFPAWRYGDFESEWLQKSIHSLQGCIVFWVDCTDNIRAWHLNL